MGVKKCPYCAEEIKEEALKCKHCGSMMPEVEQKIEEEEGKIEIAEEQAAQAMTAEYARKTIKRGYFYFFLGLFIGGGLMFVDKEAVVIPWYVIPLLGYALWSLFWGILIVHRRVKYFYSNLFVFGSGIVDLFIKQIGLRLGMYLLAIPIAGLIVGCLGGAFFKQIQFSKIVKGKE